MEIKLNQEKYAKSLNKSYLKIFFKNLTHFSVYMKLFFICFI